LGLSSGLDLGGGQCGLREVAWGQTWWSAHRWKCTVFVRFDENVPPVHSDGIRAAAVVGSEPEARMVASRSDGLGCGAHTCSSGVAGLVVDTGALGMVDMDGARAVGPCGSESDTCVGASSIGTSINPLATVVYSLLIASDESLSTNWASRDAINERVVGSSSLYPRDLSAHHPSIRHLTDAASRTPWPFRLITST
jgi:hypothetical protein